MTGTGSRFVLALLAVLFASLACSQVANAASQFRCFYAADGTIYRCSAPAAEFPSLSTRAWTRSPGATLDDGYPLVGEPGITGWRWSGAQWSSVAVDHTTRCYRPGSNCWRYPWVGAPAWSWYWEARFGWLAVPTSQVEIDVPVTYVQRSMRGQCFPGRGVPADSAPADLRQPTAYSCLFSLVR